MLEQVWESVSAIEGIGAEVIDIAVMACLQIEISAPIRSHRQFTTRILCGLFGILDDAQPLKNNGY